MNSETKVDELKNFSITMVVVSCCGNGLFIALGVPRLFDVDAMGWIVPCGIVIAVWWALHYVLFSLILRYRARNGARHESSS